MPCPQKPEEGIESPETRLTDRWKLSSGCWRPTAAIRKSSQCSQPPSHFSHPLPCFVRQDFQLVWRLPRRLGWLPSNPERSAYLCLICPGTASMTHDANCSLLFPVALIKHSGQNQLRRRGFISTYIFSNLPLVESGAAAQAGPEAETVEEACLLS